MPTRRSRAERTRAAIAAWLPLDNWQVAVLALALCAVAVGAFVVY